jgi:hypothetical protein
VAKKQGKKAVKREGTREGKTMRAMQVSAPGSPFKMVEREIPIPGPHEVLIKVAACGIGDEESPYPSRAGIVAS